MKALAEYLKRTGLTQTDFAARVGVSQPTVWNLIHGKHSASAEVLMRISRETGLTVDRLLALDKRKDHVA
jgi:transcriptional regulator with XRE-family HTH domain